MQAISGWRRGDETGQTSGFFLLAATPRILARHFRIRGFFASGYAYSSD
jgi:hypothetical protein